MSMAIKLQRAAKALFQKQRDTNAAVIKLAQLGQLSDLFSQTIFAEAAAYEVAVNRLTFTEAFVDNEMIKMSNIEITEICQERKQMLTEQMMSQVSAKMTETDTQHVNGLKLALNVFTSCLPSR